jgi:acetyltransferase-like isoleucine patch superfamily enzyme
MKKVIVVLRRLFSFHKYPRYITDVYIHTVLRFFWSSQGMKYGKGTSWLGIPIISLIPGSEIVVGRNCLCCSRSDQTALGVNHPIVLRTLSKTAELHIGSNVRMSGTTICAVKSITIGDRCVIGANVTISDTDFHSLDPQIRSSNNDSFLAISKPVQIGNDVFIGGGSVILKGVCIGNSAVIGAGSVVAKDIPAMTIAAGNPAKVIKTNFLSK